MRLRRHLGLLLYSECQSRRASAPWSERPPETQRSWNWSFLCGSPEAERRLTAPASTASIARGRRLDPETDGFFGEFRRTGARKCKAWKAIWKAWKGLKSPFQHRARQLLKVQIVDGGTSASESFPQAIFNTRHTCEHLRTAWISQNSARAG